MRPDSRLADTRGSTVSIVAVRSPAVPIATGEALRAVIAT